MKKFFLACRNRGRKHYKTWQRSKKKACRKRENTTKLGKDPKKNVKRASDSFTINLTLLLKNKSISRVKIFLQRLFWIN